MAYFIFLKYLRSLKKFRKNPHVKIPPKSPPTNFQSLGIFKNQILYEKEFSITFGPFGLSAQPRPTCFFPTGRSPSPHWALASWPAHLALSAQPTAHRWRPTGLPPPTQKSVSPRAAFAPLRAWLIGGPHLSSPSFGAT
jgi:hypothetical protein